MLLLLTSTDCVGPTTPRRQVVTVVGSWGSQPSRQPSPRTTQPTVRPIEPGSALCLCCFMLSLTSLGESDMVTEPPPSSLHPRPDPLSTPTTSTYDGHQDGRHRYISWLCPQADHRPLLVVSIFIHHPAVQPSLHFHSVVVSHFILSRQAPIILLDTYTIYSPFPTLRLFEILAIWWPSIPPCCSVLRPASKPFQP